MPNTWPPTLPEYPKKDYKEDMGLNIIRTPMDAGPAKSRYRSLKPANLFVSYDLTTAQVETLQTFFNTTLKGVKKFSYTHPRLGTTVQVRVVPASDGKLFDLSFFAMGMWTVSFHLEVLP